MCNQNHNDPQPHLVQETKPDRTNSYHWLPFTMRSNLNLSPSLPPRPPLSYLSFLRVIFSYPTCKGTRQACARTTYPRGLVHMMSALREEGVDWKADYITDRLSECDSDNGEGVQKSQNYLDVIWKWSPATDTRPRLDLIHTLTPLFLLCDLWWWRRRR